jgi:hypothetical protein
MSDGLSPDPITFAYWVPNVSGGLVTSTIEQRADWGYGYNRELAVLAENNGFEYGPSQVRYLASYGAAGRVSDRNLSNGKDFDGVSEQLRDVNASVAENGRSVGFGHGVI